MLFISPGSIGKATAAAPKCHGGQLRLPRTPRVQPTGVSESRSVWLWWHRGAVVTVFPVIPGGTVNMGHLAKGNNSLWIWPAGWSLETAVLAHGYQLLKERKKEFCKYSISCIATINHYLLREITTLFFKKWYWKERSYQCHGLLSNG